MYFPKLENLYNEQDLFDYRLIISALDSWLALLPKSYKDKITPELFSVKEDVRTEISFLLFNRLLDLKIVKERYALECPCGQVIKFEDNLSRILDFIISYNNDDACCSACDESKNLSTDNVFMVYKLIEEPIFNENKKKRTILTEVEGNSEKRNLSDRIISNIEVYINEVGKDKLMQTGSLAVRREIEFALQV
jgi:hypothetical protein